MRKLLAAAGIDEPPRYVTELKIDGLAISLLYRNGRSIARRDERQRRGGRGRDGQPPHGAGAAARDGRPGPPALVEVRGEVYLPTAAFARLNAERAEVVAEADFSGSTAAMSGFVAERRPPPVVLLTECSMSDNVAVLHPDVEFTACNLCPHMKRITLKNIRHALETDQHQVTIDPAIAAPARRAVERMLAI